MTRTKIRPIIVGLDRVYDIGQRLGSKYVSTNSSVSGLAVTPGTPHSLHLTEIDLPHVGRGRRADQSPRGRDLRERTARSSKRKFGSAPPDSTRPRHRPRGPRRGRSGRRQCRDLRARRPGHRYRPPACGCPQCAAGASDFCADMRFTERGIIGLHGFITDRFVESAEYVVRFRPSCARSAY